LLLVSPVWAADRDVRFVRELLRFLRGHGFDVWADDQVATGGRWDRVVRARIDECAAFILVMSPSADQSDWVAEEIDYARKRGKPIVPLLLDGEVFFGFI
jgi:methylmalonyl-CoA mutase cobalamin-binding subunit